MLHAAAESGEEASVRILLHFGADRKALDGEGRTAAALARAKGHAALGSLLES